MPFNILYAEDDADDRFLFNKALSEIPLETHLSSVNDGEELINYLTENHKNLPDVIFLDLNMPCKTGFECLTEIKENEKLKDVMVVMFSTSYPRNIIYEQDLKNTLLKLGADNFIRKPGDFGQLKNLIHDALIMTKEKTKQEPTL